MTPISKFVLCVSVSIGGLLLIASNVLVGINKELGVFIGMIITVSLPILLSIIIKVDTPKSEVEN